MNFKLNTKYKPSGDQPQAIQKLISGLNNDLKYQTLLGVTGSGKTFTMASVIEQVQRPALVLSHNKTLAAQLYREFKEFFPDNAVEYFVSYYDYYQPEAYIPERDLFIEKDSSINDEIERLRLSATSALLDRRDVVIVASVSCIYGLGNPADYREMVLLLSRGMQIDRKELLTRLVEMQYERNDDTLVRSTFRVRGDVMEIHPAYSREAYRIEFFGDEIERILSVDLISGRLIEDMPRMVLYPANHFVTSQENLKSALGRIEAELADRVEYFKSQGKEFEAHRLYSRTMYDLEMLREVGFCSGIENYSRHLSGREEGERPACLLDFFPDDYLLFIDESHQMLHQIRGMYNGDRARKTVLVEYGFRLPSALDNRPLQFDEFLSMVHQAVFVSATPADFEIKHSQAIVEQLIRPTGLIDPKIEVRKSEGQIDDLISEINKRIEKKERVLVTTLTKKMSEDLTDYLNDQGIRVRYLHSEIHTIERVEILRDLRAGEFDVLVGVNLLREGLDLPEVSLVAILDADKVGFLRSTRSLIQIVGRAARNVDGTVIMYSDKISDSMQQTIDETNRRRSIQLEYNKKHNITPTTIVKSIQDIIERKLSEAEEELEEEELDLKNLIKSYNLKLPEHRTALMEELEKMMFESAEKLEFEKAAQIRDEIKNLQKRIKA